MIEESDVKVEVITLDIPGHSHSGLTGYGNLVVKAIQLLDSNGYEIKAVTPIQLEGTTREIVITAQRPKG
ncbi:MAG: hypothetical protein KDA84_06750 [Planctomycetaceae bacterium]|nr:hypothetical protein [Planctomycetaceae bacterium]